MNNNAYIYFAIGIALLMINSHIKYKILEKKIVIKEEWDKKNNKKIDSVNLLFGFLKRFNDFGNYTL